MLGTAFCIFHALSHLILAALRGSHFYYPCVTDVEMAAERAGVAVPDDSARHWCQLQGSDRILSDSGVRALSPPLCSLPEQQRGEPGTRRESDLLEQLEGGGKPFV